MKRTSNQITIEDVFKDIVLKPNVKLKTKFQHTSEEAKSMTGQYKCLLLVIKITSCRSHSYLLGSTGSRVCFGFKLKSKYHSNRKSKSSPCLTTIKLCSSRYDRKYEVQRYTNKYFFKCIFIVASPPVIHCSLQGWRWNELDS